MRVTPSRGGAGLHGPFDSPGLEVLPRLLHAVLPVALGLSGDADWRSVRAASRPGRAPASEPVVRGPADVISEAEFRDGVRDALRRAARACCSGLVVPTPCLLL